MQSISKMAAVAVPAANIRRTAPQSRAMPPARHVSKQQLSSKKSDLVGAIPNGKRQVKTSALRSSRAKVASRIKCVAAAEVDDETLPPFLRYAKGGGAKGKRTDIKTIMIFGAGPIVIGQACEFDYSGTQACKALKAEGYKIILVNSNPATIMTDPGLADKTFITPMTPELVEKILEEERPDVILPTMGGQTALNLAKDLAERGVLERLGIELIGAKLDAINKAEDRDLFKQAMDRIGLKMCPSGIATTMDEAWGIAETIGSYPLIIRPSFTCGGTGGGIAYNPQEYEEIIKRGLQASATGAGGSKQQVQVDMSLLGWKEYELEVMRDLADNVMIVCSIENIDPMGVHTGDSITVAPAQTLTDKEYQRLRDASIAIIREIGVECGGSNCQFAINPADGDLVVIEMNPRVSRSSALASKATGFPIAKMAALLAVGYTLDVIANDITQKTPASFEPSIDYVVTKIPRFNFEKFPGASSTLTTQMKSVGEVMAFGRTFQESFQKAFRGLEMGLDGWCMGEREYTPVKDQEELMYNLRVPNPDRMQWVYTAFREGMTEKQINEITNIDPWFLNQFAELMKAEKYVQSTPMADLTVGDWMALKQRGFSDAQLAKASGHSEQKIRATRIGLGVVPSMKRVDTCAAEFDAKTPYMYSCYDGNDESEPTNNKKVLILGGGPNRIGQGIEFDYCCCHASYALRGAGFESIMMNSNPETVSTDYDTSDRLYFEPVTLEDVMNVVEKERPDGIIVQFGGQTPLKLASALGEWLEKTQIPASSGQGVVKIIGTSPQSIDEAEDRDRWTKLLNKLDIRQPAGGMVSNKQQALDVAATLGYPVMLRPSYVLGGRAMEILYSDEEVERYVDNAVRVDPSRAVLVDKYLDRATEVDCDALCDVEGNVVIGGVMEHIEQAGVHSGDSACSIPTQTVSATANATMREWTKAIAKELKVVGLINIQYAIQDDLVYIIEANPRASRTVPFVAKAIGRPLAKYATLLMAGQTLKQIGFESEVIPTHVAVKEAVLPFDKFPGADTLLGPEMRSTGEVMGIDTTFAMAYGKAQIAAGQRLPNEGTVFISVNDRSKVEIGAIAKMFEELGFKVMATGGTADTIKAAGVEVKKVLKIHEGRPHIGDIVAQGEVNIMIITPNNEDPRDKTDGLDLRRLSLARKTPLVTTIAGARATVMAIKALKENKISMMPLQSYFPELEMAKLI